MVKTVEQIELEDLIESLRNQSAALMKAVEQIKKTGLNEDVLVYAIQMSAKKFHLGAPISAKYVRYILSGINNLDQYLFPEKYTK